MNFTRATFFLGYFLMTASLFFAAPTVDELEAKALAAMQEGQYEEAEELLQRVISGENGLYDCPDARQDLSQTGVDDLLVIDHQHVAALDTYLFPHLVSPDDSNA